MIFRYFSNGTEGRRWQANWCDRCLHDHQFRLGRGSGCPIMARALMVDDHREIGEWIYNEEYSCGDPARRVTCIEFKPYGYRKPKPDPKPIPPGQGVLPFGEPAPVPVTIGGVA